MANHFLMQATNDKGNTWYPMALPTSWAQNILAPGNGQLENPSVQVVDNSSFYVFSLISKSLVVWTTTNSGKQFHVRRIPLDDSFQLQSVSTPGMNDAYVLLRATGKRPRPIELVHLTQGGAHVQILHLTQSHFGLGLLKNAQAVIAFTSDSRGKIAATTPDGHLYLFQTTDGGQTWRHRLVAPPQALNGSKAVHVYQPKQLGPETTFVARYVASKAGSPAIKTVVYHSADYGQHYSATLADRLDQAVADYMGTPVRFINPSYGITIADGRMLLTTDAGHSWKTLHTTVIEQTLRDYPRVLGIDYLTVNSIFVVLQSRDYRQTVCYRSTDSGLTFQKMREM